MRSNSYDIHFRAFRREQASVQVVTVKDRDLTTATPHFFGLCTSPLMTPLTLPTGTHLEHMTCAPPRSQRTHKHGRSMHTHPHRGEAGVLHAAPPSQACLVAPSGYAAAVCASIPQRRGWAPACGSPKAGMPRSTTCDHAPAVHACMHARPLSIHPASRSPPRVPSSCTRVPQSIVHAVRARGARRAVCPLTAR